jgi:dihydrofolate reductase
VHAYVNELERPIGTYLYGRRMYETMAPWASLPLDGKADAIRDFAEIWRAADKVVYSRTLGCVSTARTRLEHELDPDALRRLKAGAEHDISVGGPALAAQVIDAGLVDEVQLFLKPVVVFGGKHALPLTAEVHLKLREERRFHDGTILLRYGLASG